MKSTRMLGLAAAATALAVSIGSGSASAASSVLCKTNSTPCPATEHVANSTLFTATLETATKATLKAGSMTVQCGKSTAEIKQISTGGAAETVNGLLEQLTLSECGSCRARVERPVTGDGAPVSVSVDWRSASMDGDFTIGAGVEVEVECLGISCRYGGPILQGSFLFGGSPARLAISEAQVPKIAGGIFCAATGKFTAGYLINSPAAVWVAES